MLSLASRWSRCYLASVQASAVRYASTHGSHSSEGRQRNSKIKYDVVQCVDPETGKLLPPEPLTDILARVTMKTHYVELVGKEPPVVKIIDRKEATVERKAHKARLKEAKIEQKELQLSWNSASSDIQHKLKKARGILEDGDMVDIAFARKAKQRAPPLEVMEERLREVVESLADVAVQKRPWTLERGVGIVSLRAKPKSSNLDSLGV